MLFHRYLASILLFVDFWTVPEAKRYVKNRSYYGCKGQGSENHFNRCMDRVHGDSFKPGSKPCIDDIHGFITAVNRTTNGEIGYINKLFKHFEKKYINCPNCVVRLRTENITKVVVFYSHNLNTKNEVTKTYIKLASLIHLVNFFKCQFASQAKTCNLPFPRKVRKRLDNRLLSTKWFFLQDLFGEFIPHSRCDVVLSGKIYSSETCGIVHVRGDVWELRNIIYLMLLHAKAVLEDSRKALDWILGIGLHNLNKVKCPL